MFFHGSAGPLPTTVHTGSTPVFESTQRWIRVGSRTAATSKMERIVILANGFQPLTIITKRSIFDVAAVLDPLLWIFLLTLELQARNRFPENFEEFFLILGQTEKSMLNPSEKFCSWTTFYCFFLFDILLLQSDSFWIIILGQDISSYLSVQIFNLFNLLK